MVPYYCILQILSIYVPFVFLDTSFTRSALNWTVFDWRAFTSNCRNISLGKERLVSCQNYIISYCQAVVGIFWAYLLQWLRILDSSCVLYIFASFLVQILKIMLQVSDEKCTMAAHKMTYISPGGEGGSFLIEGGRGGAKLYIYRFFNSFAFVSTNM